MKINEQTIMELSHLCRLEFEGNELDAIKTDLEKVIGFCEKLNEVDTTNVEPLIYLTDNVNVLRKDKVTSNFTKEHALKNAPKADTDFFRVPKVIKTNRG